MKSTMSERIHAAITKFKTEIVEKEGTIDPDGLRDWYDMSIGYFLGIGLSFEESEEAAMYCYRRHYEKL